MKHVLTTQSGFSFSPPEGLFDSWDFLSTLADMLRAAKSDSDTSGMDAMTSYFDLAMIMLGPDGVQRLKTHVREASGTSYTSFKAMQAELEEILSMLRSDDAGNGSSSPV